nr:telomerase reverse transcriptase [Ipomoea batatas]
MFTSVVNVLQGRFAEITFQFDGSEQCSTKNALDGSSDTERKFSTGSTEDNVATPQPSLGNLAGEIVQKLSNLCKNLAPYYVQIWDALMVYLLRNASIFLPLSQKKLHQVAGFPITDL